MSIPKLCAVLALVCGFFLLIAIGNAPGTIFPLIATLAFTLILAAVVVKSLAAPFSSFVSATFKKVLPNSIAVIIDASGYQTGYKIVKNGRFIVRSRQKVRYLSQASFQVPYITQELREKTGGLVIARGTMNVRIGPDDASIIKAVEHDIHSWADMAHAATTRLEANLRRIVASRTRHELVHAFPELPREAQHMTDADLNQSGLQLELVHIQSLKLLGT